MFYVHVTTVSKAEMAGMSSYILYMVYTTGEFYQAKMEIRERHPQENALVCFKIAHIIELTKQ